MTPFMPIVDVPIIVFSLAMMTIAAGVFIWIMMQALPSLFRKCWWWPYIAIPIPCTWLLYVAVHSISGRLT